MFLSRFFKIDFLFVAKQQIAHITGWICCFLLFVLTATAINAHKIFLFFYYDYIHVKWISFPSFPLMLHTKKYFYDFLFCSLFEADKKECFFIPQYFLYSSIKFFLFFEKKTLRTCLLKQENKKHKVSHG